MLKFRGRPGKCNFNKINNYTLEINRKKLHKPFLSDIRRISMSTWMVLLQRASDSTLKEI